MILTMDVMLLCKTFFFTGILVASGGVLNTTFRQHIMNYGPRRKPVSNSTKKTTSKGYISAGFYLLASVQVPHTWFIYYYVVSVLSSIFWFYQIYTRGSVFEFMAVYTTPEVPGMTVNQVLLAWTCMTFQGTRRLYECFTLTKPSQSRMWIGLWIIGSLYYVFMGVSIWIEGMTALSQHDYFVNDVEISPPSMKTIIALPIFVLASSMQHDCHVYLASLVKYTLPQHWPFNWLVCPHYTSECIIYLAMTILAAPENQFFNRTILFGLAFVVTNLAVSADSTKKWYEAKFGNEKLRGRWRMIPFIF